ncbi:MAG: hypothetical protein ACKO3F_16110 [Cyanobium sp.]
MRYGVCHLEGGITCTWDFRKGRRTCCEEIGSHARAQELLRQGHTTLDGDGDGRASESLQR